MEKERKRKRKEYNIYKMSQPYLDVSSVGQLQGQYGLLLNNYTNTRNANISPPIQNLNQAYNNAQDSTNALLTQQSGVLGIIQNENTRLDDKTKAVQNMQFEQERMIQMNKNLQERTAAFNQILVVIFLSLAIMVIILSIGRFTPGSEGFVTISCILVVGIGACYSLYLYMLFNQRQVNDYNLIKFTVPANAPQSTGNGVIDNGNSSLWNSQMFCVGSQCCDGVTTTWDTDTNTCVTIGNNVSGFSTITDAYAYSDYISSQTEPISVNHPVTVAPVQNSYNSCQNPISYPSQYPKPSM